MVKKKYFDLEKHIEKEHSGIASVYSQIILGAQDGIVNTLGVVLGVLAATTSIKIALISGLAAALAESISMAAVAYTSSKASSDYYYSQKKKEEEEISKNPEEEKKEVYEVYYRKGFRGKLLKQIVEHITKNQKRFLQFMMREELELREPETNKAVNDAMIVGVSAFLGSLVPILPVLIAEYFGIFHESAIVLGLISSIFTALILFLIGAYKAWINNRSIVRDGLELMVIGMVAAIVSYGLGNLINIVLL
ncbi:MAG: VIT1/CCC1 transporter family protein [Candidatus Micrarchaeota archaeon]|nr:VIT1/CCC1 transporter family protein [Candidatus Micrarchaeota archaeon]